MYGDLDMFGNKSKNYNYKLRQENETTFKNKMVGVGILLSFIPVVYMIFNAEHTFKKAGVKEISKNRRERIEKEQGIDREQWKKDFQRLDDIYRVTEKQELEKYRRIGKSSKEFFKQKEMAKEMQEQDTFDGITEEQPRPKKSAAEFFKEKYASDEQGESMKIEEYEGDDYSSISI